MYLRTDEEAETANAMSMAAELSSRVQVDLHIWRWIIIATHNAAQGAMVLSLRHGNGLLALSNESYATWMHAYETDTTRPPEKLDGFLGLYKKVKHSEIGRVGGNQRFVPRGSEGKDIKLLNDFRNDFIHFTPKGWSLEVDGLPRICLAAARLIEFLALETTNILWHSDESRAILSDSHTRFLANMRSLHLQYTTSAA